jgi:hypothetical protein
MAISNIRFAAKPASPLDLVEDMRTAVGPGYLALRGPPMGLPS